MKCRRRNRRRMPERENVDKGKGMALRKNYKAKGNLIQKTLKRE